MSQKDGSIGCDSSLSLYCLTYGTHRTHRFPRKHDFYRSAHRRDFLNVKNCLCIRLSLSLPPRTKLKKSKSPVRTASLQAFTRTAVLTRVMELQAHAGTAGALALTCGQAVSEEERQKRVADAEALAEKLAYINERIPTRVVQIMGSNAGAGSGEFHMYRQARADPCTHPANWDRAAVHYEYASLTYDLRRGSDGTRRRGGESK